MGLQLPKRAAVPVRRVATGVLVAVTLLFLSACDATDKDQIARLAMPEPATAQAPHTYELWKWAWLAAMMTGVIVWGLIFWGCSASAVVTTTRSRCRRATTCRSRSSTRSPRS